MFVVSSSDDADDSNYLHVSYDWKTIDPCSVFDFRDTPKEDLLVDRLFEFKNIIVAVFTISMFLARQASRE